jgi:CO/xanthine dehydrogenase FAD-binding subunit
MHSFQYLRPVKLAEALGVLREHGPEARVLAGGTDLTVALREGKVKPRVVVDIKRVEDLSSNIEVNDDHIAIGALARMSDIAAHEDIRILFPALVEAAAVVGSIQIRNRATLAGNVCNASPAADTVPALAAYGASIEIAGASGRRVAPLVDFILGNRRIVLQPGELVSCVRIPRSAGPFGAAFDRITRRRGVDLATVNVCCAIDPSGVSTFAFGAVSPKPFVVKDSGEMADPKTSPSRRGALMDALFCGVSPITDVRASAEYRRAMVRVLAERTHTRATQRLAAGGRHA